MVAALLKEIDIQVNYLQNKSLETVYFGGGTPSLLGAGELRQLLEKIRERHPVNAGAEITLETNPDDISAENLKAWKEAGFNRLSIGVQSFFQEDLSYMNRAHTATQAVEGLQKAVEIFDNITADLIYGSPGLSQEKWKQNVDRLLALGIPHISCYALTVEPKTPLQKMIRAGISPAVDPDLQSGQFLLLMDWLKAAGYEHYEISNFAKPGFRSRHNSAYWQGLQYLGIGPSAHSFDGRSRQWNVSNNSQYIRAIGEQRVPFELEVLTAEQRLNEYIMTSLRTLEGIDTGVVESRFGTASKLRLLSESEKFIRAGKMKLTVTDSLALTNEGKLLADGIASDLFTLS